MSEKRFSVQERCVVDNTDDETFEFSFKIDAEIICEKLNEIVDKYEQLKKDNFICLDCEHSGYTEIGCLCEKKDCWTEYKTECEDYEELE